MNEEQIIAKIGIDESGAPTIKDPIIIKLASYKNSKYLDIRKVYEKNGEWLPTPKGITLHKEQVQELLDVLQANLDTINNYLQ